MPLDYYTTAYNALHFATHCAHTDIQKEQEETMPVTMWWYTRLVMWSMTWSTLPAPAHSLPDSD